MPASSGPKRLKKELRLRDVYAVSTGATLSAGFFLLPGIAAQEVGPALVLAYMLAAIPMIPAMFSVVELATAMPRAGGVYYFLDRSLGPMVGTIGGIGTWLALVLKVSFALIGMGAYIGLFIAELPITPVAIGLAIALGVLNLLGARKTGGFQVFLVGGLLTILAGFIWGGLPKINSVHFQDFFAAGFSSLLSTAGLVYISYVGVTNVASLSEEVKDPEHNLPRAVFLSLGTAILVYGLGTLVMVGVVPLEQLAGDLTPTATTAGLLFGPWGQIFVAGAALLAFVSVANAGTLSASRYPLAMSRDRMMPKFFRTISSRGTPTYGVLATVGTIVLILALLDPTKIAKLASAFQLLMFALVCLAVIVMRESHLESYDPGYRSPLYPWMQLLGIAAPIVLIAEMGWLSIVFSSSLVFAGAIWYLRYASQHVEREGAIYHLFARLGRRRDEGLDRELRGILKEKGLRKEDPFEEIVARSEALDLAPDTPFDQAVEQAAELLAQRVPAEADDLAQEILQGTRLGATPVTRGVALPHCRVAGLEHPEMVLVRARTSVVIAPGETLANHVDTQQQAHALFFLVSPEDDPAKHLRILAQIAGRVEEESFASEWYAARNEQELKEVLLHDECFLSLEIDKRRATASMAGRRVRDVHLPESALIAVIRRDGDAIVPSGRTTILEGDRITIIGTPSRIRELDERYAT